MCAMVAALKHRRRSDAGAAGGSRLDARLAGSGRSELTEIWVAAVGRSRGWG